MKHESENEAEHLRSDIDVTRRRMDDTMDALGERLQPRHLVDELLGFFRGSNADGESRMSGLREKVSRSANTAVHAVVDTVRQNPLPALAIGASVAWLVYESRRKRSGAQFDEDYTGGVYPELTYDPDLHYDRPLDYPSGYSGSQGENAETGSSKLGEMKDTLKEKAAAATGEVKDKLSSVGQQAREKASAFRERAGEKLDAARARAAQFGSQVQEKARQAGRRAAETAERHPLEVGLACLAAGLLTGLALRTPERVNRIAGPAADRLRQRARTAGTEMIDKGKRVVGAATRAAKDEARSQGLTPEGLRDQGGAGAPRAGENAGETGRQEGFGEPREQGGRREENAGSHPTAGDPSLARPVM